MENDNPESNCNCDYRYPIFCAHSYTHRAQNLFNRFKMALNSLFFKYNSYKARSTSTHSSSEPRIILLKVFKVPKINVTKVCITLKRIEETCFAKYTTQNRTNNAIFTRPLKIELNNREFWSVSGE